MSSEKMKCCYFPTTTIFIDDDWDFLVLSSMKLEKNAPCKLFKDPVAALEYINHDYTTQPFYKKFFTKPSYGDAEDNRTVSVDYTKIYQQIYDPNRFSEITGILVDYAMPGLTGRDFCKIALSSCDWRNWNNIILLTGESTLEVATEMIQERLINGYIFKGDSNYVRKLAGIVSDRQAEYFEQNSELFLDLMMDASGPEEGHSACFKNPDYIHFFYQMVERYKPIEYYLIDQSGSYIFLNEHGTVSWLIVQNEADMEAAEFDMSMQENVPVDLKQAIKERKALRYYFSEFPESPTTPEEWQKVIYPASRIEGASNYYYSFIEKPLVKTFIEHDKIASYSAFRAARPRVV